MNGDSYRLVLERVVVELSGICLPLHNVAAPSDQQRSVGQLEGRDLETAIVCPWPLLALAHQVAVFIEFKLLLCIESAQRSALAHERIAQLLFQPLAINIRRSSSKGKHEHNRQQEKQALR